MRKRSQERKTQRAEFGKMEQKKVQQSLNIRATNRKRFSRNLTSVIQCEWCYASQQTLDIYKSHVRRCTAKPWFSQFTDTTDLEIAINGYYKEDAIPQQSQFDTFQRRFRSQYPRQQQQQTIRDSSLFEILDDEDDEEHDPAEFVHQQRKVIEKVVMENYKDNTTKGRERMKANNVGNILQQIDQNVLHFKHVPNLQKAFEQFITVGMFFI